MYTIGQYAAFRKSNEEDHVIYTSRPPRKPRAHAYGPPHLCDFGQARIGMTQPWANIQPEVYRASEILMQFARYGSAIDLWNVGCVVSIALTPYPK